nr:MAG TPA: hypothetical protein [Caudoviricetes sp.]
MSRSTHYHHLILIYAIGRGASLPTFSLDYSALYLYKPV